MRNIIFTGRVERGEGMASRLGCPTANIAVEQGVIIPGLGIYVGEAEVDGTRHQALVCINDGRTGYRLKMEVHLLNICKDLVGKHMKVTILKKMRDLVPFENENQMAQMIKTDITSANQWFAQQSATVS